MKTIFNIVIIFLGFTLYANATGAEALVISSLVSAGTALATGLNKPKIPKAPVQTTGVQPETQSVQTLQEDNVQKQSARQTARKGAAAYRIPLQAQSTGVKTGGGTGLNI